MCPIQTIGLHDHSSSTPLAGMIETPQECLQELLAEPLQQHVGLYKQEPVRPMTRTNAKALQAVLDEMLPEGALQVGWGGGGGGGALQCIDWEVCCNLYTEST